MRMISAKVLDLTHLELSQQLDAAPGEVIQIALLSEVEGVKNVWHHAAKPRLLDSYADEDAIYDEL